MRPNKKTIGKRTAALALSASLGLSFFAGGIATAVGGRFAFADTSDTITVDTGRQFQTLDGWGSTLAWWANEIGDWTKPSAVGTTQREYIMELLYGEEGLDWNIARYNIGGGEDPTHTHMPDSRNMPGFKGAREKTEDEKADAELSAQYPANFIPDERYDFEDPSGLKRSWEQSADYNQLWALNWIQEHRDDTMTEFFSNSPPYWMTKSGCASGNLDGSANLYDEYIDDYVEYFLDVYEYLVSQGFDFDYLQPFNESTSGQWHGLSGTQEGCDFTINQKIDVLALLQDECERHGIDLGYTFSDEVDSRREVGVFAELYNSKHTASNGMTGKDIIKNAAKLTYHIYGYTNGSASWMRRAANLFDKEVEMSEICWTEGKKHDVNDMATAFKYSTSIIDILKYGGAQSYIFWQGVEDKVGQINGNSNYGLLQGVYYTAEEAMEKGVDIASLGLSYQDVTTSKAYYVSGQYSKYLKQGYKMIECLGDRAIAAVSPDGSKLVIVKQNQGSGKEMTFNLGGFNPVSVTKVTTDPDRNWEKEYLSVSGSTFKDTVTTDSVTTYIIEGVQTKGNSHFVDSSDLELKEEISEIENDANPKFGANYSVTEISLLVEDYPEKEALYLTYADKHDETNCDNKGDKGLNTNGGKGTWNNNNWKAKSYLYGGTYYTNSPNAYTVLRFKGTGFGLVAPQQNNAGAINIWIDPVLTGGKPSTSDANIIEVNLNKSTPIYREQVYRTNELEDGWHTVYVAPKSGYFNFDGFFVIEERDKSAEATAAPEFVNAAASQKDGKLYVGFKEDESLTEDGYEYFMEYRRAGGEWIRSEAEAVVTEGVSVISDTPAFSAEFYDVRAVAVKGADVRASLSKFVYFNPVKNGVLYYVDCGTSDFSNKFAGRVLGTCNSVYDQDYGVDLVTGLSWGQLNRTGGGYYASDDAFGSVATGDKTTDNKITYKFTIPAAGTYRMTLGTFDPWGVRGADVTIAGDKGMTEVSGSFTAQKSAGVKVFEFTTAAQNEAVTLTVTKDATSDNPTLSLILITDTATKLPMYANAVSDYAEQVASSMDTLPIGSDYTEELNRVEVKVTMSDGTEETHSVANGNLVFDSATLESVKNGSALKTEYTLTFDGMPDMKATLNFQAAQSGKETYYNIDSGSDGTNPAPVGTKQGSNADQADDSSTWGYFNAGNTNWANDTVNSSIREFAKTGDSGYNFRGFEPNEALTVTIGSNVHNWPGRTTAVRFNDGAEESTLLQPAANGGNVEATYSATADSSGNLKVRFITKTSNEGPQISFVRVESVPAGGSGSLITAIPQKLTSDKASYTPNAGEKIVLSNVASGATVYVLDTEDNLVDCITAEGTPSATPTYGTLEWNNWAALQRVNEYAEGLRFAQAYVGNENASDELTVSLLVKPMLDVQFARDAIEDGGIVILRFTPRFPAESTRSVTGFALRLPDEYGAVEVNLLDSFFFRTVYNGDYTAIMTVDGVAYEYPFTVDVVDTITLSVVKDEAYTSGPVSVALTPASTKGVQQLLLNGEEKQLDDGSYVFSATENGRYTVEVVSLSGFKKTFTFEVNNIEAATPSLDMSVSYDFASGLKVNYKTNASGGALYVSVNDKTAVAVAEGIDLLASEDGKYVFYVENGVGAKSAEKVYYVTHDASKARLGTVAIGADGTVSVSGASAKLYRAGEKTPLNEMNVSANGKYYLELTSADGTELVVVNQNTALSIDWVAVSDTVGTALTVVFSIVAVGLVAGIVVLVVVKRRKS